MHWINLAKRVALSAIILSAPALTGCDNESALNASTAPPAAPPSAAPAPKPATAPVKPFKPSSVALNEQFRDDTGPANPDKVIAKVLQTVRTLNRPASCAVSLDGRHLFVTNSAATLNGMLYQQGGVSKFAINPADGRLTMVEQKFAENLQQPLGIAVLPRATQKFPAGSLFISTGTTAACDENNDRILEVTKFKPGVTVLDPQSGKQLGFIPMGPGAAVAKSIFHPVIAPAGLCFDPAGDLFVADCGNTGKGLLPDAIFGQPGLVRIAHAALDAVAEDKDAKGVTFLSIRHVPAAVYYSSLDDAIYWTTSDGTAAGGGVYRMPRKSFPEHNMAQNVVGELGPLMGLTITPNGTLIVSRLDGDLTYVNRQKYDQVLFDDNGLFSSPWDIKSLTLKNGATIIYVPEQEPNATEPWQQRLRVVLLPSAM